jgi:hypothetical protein
MSWLENPEPFATIIVIAALIAGVLAMSFVMRRRRPIGKRMQFQKERTSCGTRFGFDSK